ncbi:class II fructose-bisphosphate aldolase [Alkalihalobacillus sp. BA299]|uniref:class II fructose-bisphosphate aldolase n=1 Tax=Alkalihalobacillus sp. BA299 TaxID=2815938 RepID=UPI001ADB04F3|nr:class II fructose-bisphosphate aldolase [Alkalihalobacillus sp. BA299]
MLVSLHHIIDGLKNANGAIPAFNVFGYEDAIAVVRAAEEVKAPVILATNKVAIAHMPIQLLGNILTTIAKNATVPVVVHLDHGADYETVAQAIMSGYTSVMYDGSQLPLAENIRTTQEITRFAHACGVPIEAEIGSVGYSDLQGHLTDPQEAKRFAEETGVDTLAVAIGTVHRMEEQTAQIDFVRLKEIEAVVDTPLVLHGSTGVSDIDIQALIKHHFVKVNIGTAIRMAFGHTMRKEMEENPYEFDRITLFKEPMRAVQEEVKKKLTLLQAHQYLTKEQILL